MPLSICRKINAHVKPFDITIVYMCKTYVKIVGELNDVLSSQDHRIHQIIDISAVDILEDYFLVGIR